MYEFTWKTGVLIPKGTGDFRGIGLVEMLWKTVKMILNRRLMAAIQFYDTLYRFRTVRGTGNASLRDNLLQKLTVITEEVLYMRYY